MVYSCTRMAKVGAKGLIISLDLHQSQEWHELEGLDPWTSPVTYAHGLHIPSTFLQLGLQDNYFFNRQLIDPVKI